MKKFRLIKMKEVYLKNKRYNKKSHMCELNSRQDMKGLRPPI